MIDLRPSFDQSKFSLRTRKVIILAPLGAADDSISSKLMSAPSSSICEAGESFKRAMVLAGTTNRLGKIAKNARKSPGKTAF